MTLRNFTPVSHRPKTPQTLLSFPQAPRSRPLIFLHSLHQVQPQNPPADQPRWHAGRPDIRTSLALFAPVLPETASLPQFPKTPEGFPPAIPHHVFLSFSHSYFSFSLVLFALFKLHFDLKLRAVAENRERHFVADLILLYERRQRMGRINPRECNCKHDIAFFQPRFLGRTSRHDCGTVSTLHQPRAIIAAELFFFGDLFGNQHVPYTKIRTYDFAVRRDTRHIPLHAVGRDRKSDIFRALGNGRIDPDHLAVHIDERPAGIARIDRCIRLDQFFQIFGRHTASPRHNRSLKSRHHADGNCIAELAKRIADRNGSLSDSDAG